MSDEEYKDGLAYVNEELPDHPLLEDLRAGQSKINEIYLQRLIEKARAKVKEESEDKPIDSDDPKLMHLNAKRRKLYGRRAKLSNFFHEIKSVKDRAYNSEQIQIIQREIIAIEAQINHWKLTGERPKGPFEHLPDDRYELFKIKENARKHIPRLEQSLEELYNMPKNTPNRAAKIAEKEKKLAETKRLKVYVEKTLEDANV